MSDSKGALWLVDRVRDRACTYTADALVEVRRLDYPALSSEGGEYLCTVSKTYDTAPLYTRLLSAAGIREALEQLTLPIAQVELQEITPDGY